MKWVPVSQLLLAMLVFISHMSMATSDASNQSSPDFSFSSERPEAALNPPTPPPSPPPKKDNSFPSVEQLLWDNVKLIERSQLLEQTLYRTLEALSFKLGDPFDDIIDFLHSGRSGAASRRSADKIVPDVINSYSMPSLNVTNTQKSTYLYSYCYVMRVN